MDDPKARCAIAICELDSQWNALNNQWVTLPMNRGDEHHEDPRLFVFAGRLHMAYTDTLFHPGQPYTCCLKYCRLAPAGRKGLGWKAEEVFHPQYGNNSGMAMEKNWQFFQHDGKLRAIYSADPHVVLELDGANVVSVSEGPGSSVVWPWGTIRGGTPPIMLPSGEYLTVFHSALPYPVEPFWRRYYAGAYTFEAKAPFKITKISQSPILTGSGADGHTVDPRKLSWKPFVVFPSGIIPHAGGFHVSYGINDYITCIADHVDFNLGDPLFGDCKPRFFMAENGTMPLKLQMDYGKPNFMRWEQVPDFGGMGRRGVIKVTDPMLGMRLSELAITEITEAEYIKSTSIKPGGSFYKMRNG
jgi:predicted GH43/DUF377 family glycosyl hydrolase